MLEHNGYRNMFPFKADSQCTRDKINVNSTGSSDYINEDGNEVTNT